MALRGGGRGEVYAVHTYQLQSNPDTPDSLAIEGRRQTQDQSKGDKGQGEWQVWFASDYIETPACQVFTHLTAANSRVIPTHQPWQVPFIFPGLSSTAL